MEQVNIPHPEKWLSPDGNVISCAEKIKVLNQNWQEIQQLCKDALEDAVLMGCDGYYIKQVMHQIIDSLEKPFSS